MRTRRSFTRTILPHGTATDAAARSLAGPVLAAALQDSRRRTLALVQDLSTDQWLPPHQAGVNPVAWELGHLAWFAEFWTRRGPHRLDEHGFVHARHPPAIVGPDAVFDSARLGHAQRWTTKLPARSELFSLLQQQLEACIESMPNGTGDDAALYFHRLSLFHEDMHGEAFAWMRAALGYPAPDESALREQQAAPALHFDGDDLPLAPSTGIQGFLFDNEMRHEPMAVRPFEIDARCVTAGQFLEFVDAGGYERPEFWPGDAGTWRTQGGRSHPERWRRDGSDWRTRWFDRWEPLDPLLPVVHVSAFEAQAYCAWRGRRLPHALEWEYAATHAPTDRFRWGASVWEWTGDAFAPYAGFLPGPYRDYSLPWFGNHRELRGGSFATHARMHHPRYRNFFQPHRADIFAGFRTARSL
ncbi:MAG: SUMF1/EgtB/PvdO family nonheme iron enzyme [Proteobacteria bacterium]|nr:SUMF1/EgtB/PvdO family nonheme iron enzyme [Pseudomonadota bacterium]